MVQYANYLKIVFMNINEILEMRNNREQLIECAYKITHISAAIYPRFHTYFLNLFQNQSPEKVLL